MPPRQPKATTVPEESVQDVVEIEEVAIEEVQFGGLADQPVIVQKPYKILMVFTSPTCGPCRTLKPLLAEIDRESPFLHEIVSYDADTAELFKQFGVRNVPALVHVDVTYDGSELVKTALDMATGFSGELPLRNKLKEWGYLA